MRITPNSPSDLWPQHAVGLSDKVVRAQAVASMRRLGTDRIDVYYAHIEDRRAPLDDTVATFASLVTDGLVRVTGCSNHAAWRVAKAREIARAAGLAGFQLRSAAPYLPAAAVERLLYRVTTDPGA